MSKCYEISRHSNGVVKGIYHFKPTELPFYAIRTLDFHREDGPAVLNFTSYGRLIREEWWLNGKQHRVDGPAVIGYTASKNRKHVRHLMWMVNDEVINDSVNKWMRINHIKSWIRMTEIEKLLLRLQVTTLI
jgi:hypothetical protein